MPKAKRVRKAVLPVAGLGTRFLPATKAMPKEMLPVVDKPLIQYAVEECIASGIENVIFITGRRKSAIEDHFDFAPELEQFLEERGKEHQISVVRDISTSVNFSYTRQREALGLGHAVLTARELVGDEPFAVLLGDVILTGAQPATGVLADIYHETGQGAIVIERVPKDKVHMYGIAAPQDSSTGNVGERFRIRDLVEKPKPADAPSNLAITGRYVLPPEIFGYLENVKPGSGGEIQLTDALRELAKNEGLWGYVYEGKSYDAGDKLGFLKATVELALLDPNLGKDFKEYLEKLEL